MVNKNSINMNQWQKTLNGMYEIGFKLEHVFEQDGNTVMVFAHAWH